jgi:hypothetical protein
LQRNSDFFHISLEINEFDISIIKGVVDKTKKRASFTYRRWQTMRRLIGITGIGTWISATVILVVLAVQAPVNGEPMFENLPEGWQVERSFRVPRDQRMAIGRKLGGRMVKLSNTVLSYQGKSLQVNVLDAASESAAERIYQSILKAHDNDPLYALLDGKRTIEFAKTNDAELVQKTRVALGLDKGITNEQADAKAEVG